MSQPIIKMKDVRKARDTEMPLKAKEVEVVFCGPMEEYGLPPLSNKKPSFCLVHLVDEYNRTSGRVPYNFKDLRMWKKRGILMLDSSKRDMRNITHFLRFLSLRNKNVIFIFAKDENCKYLATLLSDNSHESNHYLWYPNFKESDVFKHVDSIRKFLGLKPVNWNPAV